MGYQPYADDCVHLKACRRLVKIARSQTKRSVTRYCTPDSCSAYVPANCEDRYIEVGHAARICKDVAEECAYRGLSDDCYGLMKYDMGDYAKTLSEWLADGE